MIKFLKDWTLPVAIALGTIIYLTFYFLPALDTTGNRLSPIIDAVFPLFVFLTLLTTFIKIDYHQLKPHRWQFGVLTSQLLLIALNVMIIKLVEDNTEQKLLWEGVLTCVIAPAATAAPVVTGKLGGNISTMTMHVLMSSILGALVIPFVFPLIEKGTGMTFFEAFAIILQKVAMVLLLPLFLGYFIHRYLHRMRKWVTEQRDLAFYLWCISLTITSGITVKNIVHAEAGIMLIVSMAFACLIVSFIQFGIGRVVGKHLGEPLNAGQAMFQKNTALSIWVAYMYLHPVASIGAGCYVLWQNIINSIELWQHRHRKE